MLRGRAGKERFQHALLLARQAGRLAAARAAAPLLRVTIRPARAPARLLIAPQDIRVADPTVAEDIYAGHFALADRVVNGHGRSPFEIDPPSPAWAEALHSFNWLRHLRAADTALSRANARALVDDWIGAARRGPHPAAFRPAVMARRILSWLSQSPVILDGADGRFHRAFTRSIMGQAAALQRGLSGGMVGEARLWAALAVAEVCLCTDKAVTPKRVYAQLLAELDRQVLADGGHISRNPQAVVDLLLDLLPLRQVFAARGAPVPEPVLNAIDRMIPMLRLFRHADGSLALFNGMGVTQPEVMATIAAYDDARAMPLSNAPYSGYQRLAFGSSAVICDTGVPPPLLFFDRAHAGTLAFEFSSAGQAMVVNCGRPTGSERPMLRAARSTAAHSTLVLADRSSCRFLPGGRRALGLEGVVVAGPTQVLVGRELLDGEEVVEASHDGYRGLGFVHRRRLRLARTGTLLRGEDEVLPVSGAPGQPDTPFAIRFHLHPAVQVDYAPAGTSILIGLPSGVVWRFEAGGMPLSIEESIFFGHVGGARRTQQIVVRGSTAATPAVPWSFTERPVV